MLPNKSNKTQETCHPTSSNCVIWQGPDIPCINLCTGDTISDVVAKLANELCTIMDELKISAYDLSCFNPICPQPQDFQGLVQFLIDKICTLSGETTTNTGSIRALQRTVTTGCPDCVVPLATCFYYTDPLGDTVTTMQLRDYVIAAGNRICSILTSIVAINTQISGLDGRVTYLEQISGISQAIVVPTSCVTPLATDIPIVTFVTQLENAFCALQTATGTPTQLGVAVGSQCVAGSDYQLGQDPQTQWSTNPAFINSPSTAADAITNMWLTICDLRTAVSTLQSDLAACCTTKCSDNVLTAVAEYVKSTTSVDVTFSGSFVSGYAGCTGTSVITVNGTNGQVPVINNTATVNIGTVSTDINGASIFYSLYYLVTVDACYTDGSSTCSQSFTFPLVTGNIDCPVSSVASWSNPTAGVARFTFTTPSPTPMTYILTITNTTSGDVETHVVNTTGASTNYVQNSILGTASDGFELTSCTMIQGAYSMTCNSNGYIYYIAS